MASIFTMIINGEIPCSKIYEDEDFIAIIDIRPVHLGHTLLITKKEYINIYDTPDEIGTKVYPLLKKLSTAVKEATGCDGINIVQNNEAAAGQEVFHSHIHIIPRFEKDGLRFASIHKEYENPAQMNEFADKIKSCIR